MVGATAFVYWSAGCQPPPTFSPTTADIFPPPVSIDSRRQSTFCGTNILTNWLIIIISCQFFFFWQLTHTQTDRNKMEMSISRIYSEFTFHFASVYQRSVQFYSWCMSRAGKLFFIVIIISNKKARLAFVYVWFEMWFCSRSEGGQMAADGVALADAGHRRILPHHHFLRTSVHGQKETLVYTRNTCALQSGHGTAQSLHRSRSKKSFVFLNDEISVDYWIFLPENSWPWRSIANSTTGFANLSTIPMIRMRFG